MVTAELAHSAFKPSNINSHIFLLFFLIFVSHKIDIFDSFVCRKQQHAGQSVCKPASLAPLQIIFSFLNTPSQAKRVTIHIVGSEWIQNQPW